MWPKQVQRGRRRREPQLTLSIVLARPMPHSITRTLAIFAVFLRAPGTHLQNSRETSSEWEIIRVPRTMTTPMPSDAPPPPPARFAKVLAVACLTVGIIGITTVLPAEFGVDPLGTGQWLGLTRGAGAPPPTAGTATSTGAAMVVGQRGPAGNDGAGFKYDVYDIVLEPYEYVEYKYQLEQGATMLYSWTATETVMHDFHGAHADGARNGAPLEQSYDKRQRRQASGTFAAPFTGIHGWYWENPGAQRVSIRLTSAGFYTSAIEIRSDRSRQTRSLRESGDLK